MLQRPWTLRGSNMNSPTLLFLTSLIGIIPAILLLYYVLQTYDEYFKDSTLYIFFAGGMILGMVSFVLNVIIVYNNSKFFNYVDISILIYVLAFAAFEELMKYIILYLKWFRGQHSTTYYGVAFGLGFGATSIMAIAYRDIYMFPGAVLTNPYILPTDLALSLGYVGLHATTGGLIGFGSAKKIRWTMILMALGLHLVFNFILLGFWWVWYPTRFGDALLLAGIGLAGVYFFRKEYMSRSLTGKLSRERRRKMKAAHREAQRRMARGLPKEKSPGMPGLTFGEKTPFRKSTEEE